MLGFPTGNSHITRDLRDDPGGGGGLLHTMPYRDLYGEAPPERGIFFRLQVYERVGISLVEVYIRIGKSVVWVCERAKRVVTDEFYGFIKSRKRRVFIIDCYLKDSAFTAVKRNAKF